MRVPIGDGLIGEDIIVDDYDVFMYIGFPTSDV